MAGMLVTIKNGEHQHAKLLGCKEEQDVMPETDAPNDQLVSGTSSSLLLSSHVMYDVGDHLLFVMRGTENYVSYN